MKNRIYLTIVFLFLTLNIFCQSSKEKAELIEGRMKVIEFYEKYPEQLANAAKALEDSTIIYDPSYVRIKYPNGDIDPHKGVCTDVVIRAFRKAWDWDLQKTIHEFIKEQHPEKKLDSNIDHRRVRNLMEFFDVYFDTVQLYNQYPDKFRKGNIIIWDLGGGQLHIGICVDDDMVIHNICCGQVIEPIFAKENIIRNYSFYPDFHKEVNKFLNTKQ